MIQYRSDAVFLYKYAVRVLPEAEKLFDITWACFGSEKREREEAQDARENGVDFLSLQCCCLLALFPGSDPNNAIAFITALYSLTRYLDALCRRNGIQDETAVRKLYPALQDAVDPERTTGGYQFGYSLTAGKQVIKLVDQCKFCITALPSYKLVTGKMKKYVQLYIDLQTYRYLPPIIRREYMESWAGGYLKRYTDVSCWEFSAAAGSLMGILFMFAAASDPYLTPGDVNALDEACFPWICGLQKLLESYISARDSILADSLNFTSFYGNLKQCEERLDYFALRAAVRTSGLKSPEFHAAVIRCLLALYLSDPRAFFGMYRLASGAVIRNGPSRTAFYWRVCRLLRRISVL